MPKAVHTAGAQCFLILQSQENQPTVQNGQLVAGSTNGPVRIILVNKQPYPGHEDGWNNNTFDCVGGAVNPGESRIDALCRGVKSKLGLDIQSTMNLGELYRYESERGNDTLTVYAAWIDGNTDLDTIAIDTNTIRALHTIDFIQKENGGWGPADDSFSDLYPLYQPFVSRLLNFLTSDGMSDIEIRHGQKDPEGGNMDSTLYGTQESFASYHVVGDHIDQSASSM